MRWFAQSFGIALVAAVTLTAAFVPVRALADAVSGPAAGDVGDATAPDIGDETSDDADEIAPSEWFVATHSGVASSASGRDRAEHPLAAETKPRQYVRSPETPPPRV